MTEETSGLVRPVLDEDGKPELAVASTMIDAGTFAEWYRDVDGVNAPMAGAITLWPSDGDTDVNRFGPDGEQYAILNFYSWGHMRFVSWVEKRPAGC